MPAPRPNSFAAVAARILQLADRGRKELEPALVVQAGQVAQLDPGHAHPVGEVALALRPGLDETFRQELQASGQRPGLDSHPLGRESEPLQALDGYVRRLGRRPDLVAVLREAHHEVGEALGQAADRVEREPCTLLDPGRDQVPSGDRFGRERVVALLELLPALLVDLVADPDREVFERVRHVESLSDRRDRGGGPRLEVVPHV